MHNHHQCIIIVIIIIIIIIVVVVVIHRIIMPLPSLEVLVQPCCMGGNKTRERKETWAKQNRVV